MYILKKTICQEKYPGRIFSVGAMADFANSSISVIPLINISALSISAYKFL
jgi:hypothetical protein